MKRGSLEVRMCSNPMQRVCRNSQDDEIQSSRVNRQPKLRWFANLALDLIDFEGEMEVVVARFRSSIDWLDTFTQ